MDDDVLDRLEPGSLEFERALRIIREMDGPAAT
jgi:hypothetical protein